MGMGHLKRHRTKFIYFFCLSLLSSGNYSYRSFANDSTWLTTIYQDTRLSMKKMQDPVTKLIDDRLQSTEKDFPKSASRPQDVRLMPTNIAFDLMLELNEAKKNPTSALEIEKKLKNLQKLPKYISPPGQQTLPNGQKTTHGTELFFTRYARPNPPPNDPYAFEVEVDEVSSIDNLHLALSLWLTTKTLPGTGAAKEAQKILSKMNFSEFLKDSEGQVHGVLKPTGPNGSYQPAEYTYRYWGAEARSLYSLGYAMKLFKDHDLSDFPKKSSESVVIECTPALPKNSIGPILKTWDGGAFQLLLPDILYSESTFSATTKNALENYAKFLRLEQSKRSLLFPPASSASQFSLENCQTWADTPTYVGFSGLPFLTPSWRELSSDEKAWHNRVMTPHALLLAAVHDLDHFKKEIRAATTYQDKRYKSYYPEYGFADGIHIAGPHKGRVVPAQLSLDQGMIALAIEKIQAGDNHTLLSRTLNQDPEIRTRLHSYYRVMEDKLQKACGDSLTPSQDALTYNENPSEKKTH